MIRCRWDREGRIDALALVSLDGRADRGGVELGAWRVEEAIGTRRASQDGRLERSLVVTVTSDGRTSAGRLRGAFVKGIRDAGRLTATV